MTSSRSPFPLIRHLSRATTPLLLALPVTANQVTAASLLAGLGSAWMAAEGTARGNVWAGLLMVLCYVLDNCDGEVARGKNQCSEFGRIFDTVVDWIVHSAFFAGLGYGVAAARGESWWLWAGLAGAAGGTINYFLGLWLDARDQATVQAREGGLGEDARAPHSLAEWVLFALRELTRADFCFIILALAVAGPLWVLVPLGAVGAQAYWAAQFIGAARRFHV